MSCGLTLEQIQEQLAAWLLASTNLAAGKSATIGQRTITRADASEVRSMIGYWNRACIQASKGRGSKNHRQIRFTTFSLQG